MKTKRKKVAIVAGGRLHKRFLKDIASHDVVIGVDKGAFWLVAHGVTPDIAIGDFDSVTGPEKQRIHDESRIYMEFAPEKDATDLELAVEEAIRTVPSEVKMYGALGTRSDHSLAAIHMLLRLVSHNIYGEIVDNFNKINIVRHKIILMKDNEFPYVSVLPIGNQSVSVTLTGFVYNLSRFTITADTTLGISNNIRNISASITVHRGFALVVQSVDL